MAIQLPQSQPKVRLKPQPQTRVSGAQGPTLSGAFIDTLSTASTAQEKARLKAVERQRKYVGKKFSNAASDLSVMAKTQVVSAKGENSIKATDEQRVSLRQGLDKLVSGVPEQFRQGVELSADSSMADFNRTAIPHQGKELRANETEVYKSDVKNKMNRAVEVSPNLDEFEVELTNVAAAATEQAQLESGDNKELIDDHVSKIISSTILSSVQHKSSYGSIQDAKDTIKRFGNRMHIDDLKKAAEALEKGEEDFTTDAAMELMEKAQAAAPSSVAAQEKFIRANSPNADIYKESVSMMVTSDSIIQKNKKRAEDKVLGTAYDQAEKIIEDGTQIPPGLINIIPGEKRNAFRNYIANGGKVPTVRKVARNLDIMHRTDPEAYKRLNLSMHKGELTTSDYTYYRGLQDNLIKSDSNQAFKIKVSNDRASQAVTQSFIKSNDIIDPEMIGDLEQITREAHSELSQVEGITTKEIQARIYKALVDSGTTVESVWFGLRDDKITVADSLELDLSPVKGQVVAHPSWIDAIQKSRKDSGKDPMTTGELNKFLDKIRTKGRDTDLPFRGR